jgi:hypothetical protein
MRLERTMAGLEARLTPQGAGRWGGAAFLAVWLVFWVVGEGFALWFLIAGGWALATGQPLGAGKAPPALAPALLAGVFLTGWLAFWTLGGLMAWHEFLRLVWSSDLLRARGDGLEVVRRIGPFTRTRFLPRDTLRALSRTESHPAVQAETTDGVVELTRNGTPAEQAALIQALATELRLPATDRLPPVLPAAWREVTAPEGDAVLVKDPAVRRKAALVMWILALPLTWAALSVLREAWVRPNSGAVAAILAVVAGFALWGAGRLTWAREEWRLEPGRVVRQRRSGSRRREGGAGTALRLTETTDSDGDRLYKLSVLGDAGQTRTLGGQMHDPTEPRLLARWLAARTGMPFEDLATAEERARNVQTQAEARRLAREWVGEWLRSLPGFGRRRD